MLLELIQKIKSWFRPKAEPDYQAYQACEDYENSQAFVPGKPGALPDLPAQPDPEPIIEEPISSQEAAVDTKDDGIDLSIMNKAELLAFAKERGIAATAKMKKQEIIDAINSVQ